MSGSRLSTTCCIAGGGPAGVMLGLLLARAGVDAIVLEKHSDFFRDFRGDTIHPSTIDLIDQLSLRERFDAIRQTAIRTLDVVINGNRLTPVDFSHLRGRNRSIALMPQWDFLALLAEEGARYPGFHLMMGRRGDGYPSRRRCGAWTHSLDRSWPDRDRSSPHRGCRRSRFDGSPLDRPRTEGLRYCCRRVVVPATENGGEPTRHARLPRRRVDGRHDSSGRVLPGGDAHSQG